MKRLLSVVTNKFLVTAVVFAVWMIFFDQNDYESQKQRKQDLKTANDGIAYLNNEVGRMEKEYGEITTDPQKLEQYAREQYRMKRDNEDVYIVETKK
jgi:cell division protein FtsB